jgi:hypothetical protein
VIPILVKPEAVKVTLLPAQAAPDGFVTNVGIVGQTLQPPGPLKAKLVVAVQPLAAVTVTLYDPTVKPVWFWLVGFTPDPDHAKV